MKILEWLSKHPCITKVCVLLFLGFCIPKVTGVICILTSLCVVSIGGYELLLQK